MNKLEMTESIVAAKTSSGLGWEAIAEKVGLAPVFLTSACLGMNSLKPEYADKLCEVLELSNEVSVALQQFPHKSWDKLVPTDPVIYRLYEIVGVYGDTIKEINHRSINTVDEYNTAIGKVKKGDAVIMLVRRANSGFFVIKLTKD